MGWVNIYLTFFTLLTYFVLHIKIFLIRLKNMTIVKNFGYLCSLLNVNDQLCYLCKLVYFNEPLFWTQTLFPPPIYYPFGWGYKIHRLLLCRGVRPFPIRRPGYDTKQSNGELPVMLELWEMQRTSLLLLLPTPLRSGVVALDRVLSIGQIELNTVLMPNRIVWNINLVC